MCVRWLNCYGDEGRAKRIKEPVACCLVGAIFLPISPAMALYCLIGSVGLRFQFDFSAKRDEVRKGPCGTP